MRPNPQKQSELRIVGRIIPQIEDNATSRVLQCEPPAGAGGSQVAGFINETVFQQSPCLDDSVEPTIFPFSKRSG